MTPTTAHEARAFLVERGYTVLAPLPEATLPAAAPEDHGADELLALINAIVRLGGDGALVDGLWDRYCRLSEHLGFVPADEIAADYARTKVVA